LVVAADVNFRTIRRDRDRADDRFQVDVFKRELETIEFREVGNGALSANFVAADEETGANERREKEEKRDAFRRLESCEPR
jgi:hypothetical protein